MAWGCLRSQASEQVEDVGVLSIEIAEGMSNTESTPEIGVSWERVREWPLLNFH